MIRVPETESVIPTAVLDGLSMGQLQALGLRVIQTQRDKVLDSQAYYEFARYSLASGADWSTAWAAEPASAASKSRGKHAGPTPDAPEDFYNTLPGMLDNLISSMRIQDAVIANLAQMADRAYRYDRDTVLGIPSGVDLFKNGKRWFADRFQIETRQASKFYSRAELIAAEPASIKGLGKAALLPKMAAEYNAGKIPSENMDRMTLVAKKFYDFYQLTGLSKSNAEEILAAMDGVFTEAAVHMKPQALTAESQNWLDQIAAIVDPDGPPPQLGDGRAKNALNTKIVNGKLHIHVVTDIVNMELIEALILAGLNYRANQDKFRQNSEDDNSAGGPTNNPDVSAEDSDDPSTESAAAHDVSDDIDDADNDQAPQSAPDDDDKSGGLFEGEGVGSTPYDEDMTAEERLALFHQRMDEAVNDPETYVETQDGTKVSRGQLRALDPRSRTEKAHDVFMTILKAQGKRSPGADGMAEYKRAPAILWTVMDYETLLQLQRDRIPAQYQLQARHKRPPGLAGYDPGPPVALDPLSPSAHADHSGENTAGPPCDGASANHELGEDPLLASLPWSTCDEDGEPPPDNTATGRQRGHPYVARRFQTGHISPASVLQDLCDAKIIPGIFNQAGVPLFLGRGKRVFSDDQILAAAMLGGCRGPGCKVPPVWTDGHHGIFWLHGGGTNTTNLILLCNACHTHVHQGVWTPTWTNEGILYWIPAPWLDPTQTPIRNTYWD